MLYDLLLHVWLQMWAITLTVAVVLELQAVHAACQEANADHEYYAAHAMLDVTCSLKLVVPRSVADADYCKLKPFSCCAVAVLRLAACCLACQELM